MLHPMLRPTIVLIGLMLFGGWNTTDASAQPARPDIIYKDVHIFNVSKSRGWLDKVFEFHQSAEAKAIAQAIAAIFDIPPAVTGRVVEAGQAIAASVIKQSGQEEVGIFRSPEGYTFCQADLLGTPTIVQTRNHIVTLLGIVARSWHGDDGLAYKVIVPQILNEHTSVSARIRLTYVIADPPRVVAWTKAGKCTAHNVCPWIFDGAHNGTRDENCNPGDHRPDRWLTGQWGP